MELLWGSEKESILGVTVSCVLLFYKEALPACDSAVCLLVPGVEGIPHVVN